MLQRLFYLTAISGLLFSCGTLKKLNAGKDESKVNLVTSDIDNFWKAFDKDAGRNQAMTYQALYLDKASPGLSSFIKLRIGNANNLTKAIYENRQVYEAARGYSEQLGQTKTVLSGYFERVKEIYPEAIFPDVYFVVGINNTGGTISNKGLLIGIEKFNGADELYPVIIHELIHYQQKYYFQWKSFTLLEQSIKEGSADFLSELAIGKPITGSNYEFGRAHEAELKEEFRLIMHRKWKEGWEGWMYGGARDGRPDDLAYWMGYQVVKAYYDRAEDKKKAVRDILSIRNFDRFVKESGYFEASRVATAPHRAYGLSFYK